MLYKFPIKFSFQIRTLPALVLSQLDSIQIIPRILGKLLYKRGEGYVKIQRLTMPSMHDF